MQTAPLYLKKSADRRLHTGHLWIYSNEVDVHKSPLSNFEPGQLVTIFSYNNKILGIGYVNPHSLISARLLSREPHLEPHWLAQRLKQAQSWRNRMFEKPFYRLVFGESDELPGLVVDRFGDILSVQITTAGMERVRNDLLAALDHLLRPRVIVLRNDTSVRTLEGLNNYVEVAQGNLPPEIFLEENGVSFQVDVLKGQKTGWFYDHRLNRARLSSYVKQQRVLDVFSYTGAWGIQAAVAGAKEVWCLDSSAPALEYVQHHAALNQVTQRVQTLPGDAWEILKKLRQEGRKFDVIILDPPAFIKRKKDQIEGEQAYYRLNHLAMQLLDKEGILMSASCSLQLSREHLLNLLRAASQRLAQSLQILEQGHQAPDHPIHPAIPETDYLKMLIGRTTGYVGWGPS